MTNPAPSGGPSPLRVAGLALVGVAAVAAIIGLATLTTGGPDTSQTASPSSANSTSGEPAPGLETSPPLIPNDTGVPLPVDPSVAPEGVAPPAPAPGEAPAPGQEPAPGAPGDPAPAPGAVPPPAAPPAAPPVAPPPAAPPPAAAPQPAAPPPAAAPAPGGSGNGNSGNGNSGSGDGERAASGGGGSATAARAPLRVYNNSRIEGLAARAAEDFRRAGWVVTDVGPYGGGVLYTSTVYYRPGTGEEAPARALAAQFGLRVEERFPGIRDASPGIIVIITREYGTQ